MDDPRKGPEVNGGYRGSQPAWKKLLGRLSDKGPTVYRVCGDYVRTNIWLDFTMGGHPHVYRFVPKDEVWVEGMSCWRDEYLNLFHEVMEWSFMEEGMPYARAHRFTSEAEQFLRFIWADHLADQKPNPMEAIILQRYPHASFSQVFEAVGVANSAIVRKLGAPGVSKQ